MTEQKNNNKSMFLYTALIFIVAVLLIIISFFGQTNLEKNQPKIDDEAQQTLSGIAERASVLSEENKVLMEENTKLKEENTSLYQKETENNILLSANGYYLNGDYDKAGEIIGAVNYENLTSDQKLIYDNIKNNIAERNN